MGNDHFLYTRNESQGFDVDRVWAWWVKHYVSCVILRHHQSGLYQISGVIFVENTLKICLQNWVWHFAALDSSMRLLLTLLRPCYVNPGTII